MLLAIYGKKHREDEANIVLLIVAVKNIRATLMERTAKLITYINRQTDTDQPADLPGVSIPVPVTQSPPALE